MTGCVDADVMNELHCSCGVLEMPQASARTPLRDHLPTGGHQRRTARPSLPFGRGACGAALPKMGGVHALAFAPLFLALALTGWVAARRSRTGSRLALPVVATAAASLTTTAVADISEADASSLGRHIEMLALAVLLTAVCRWAPARQAIPTAVLSDLAIACWTLPLLPSPSVLERTGAFALWSLPALTAAVVGGYPRLMEQRRREAVTQARRTQQLRIARDLHDYVAHDISGIIAQSQAARYVAATDPHQAGAALERIERAGLNALSSMDRMVEMLRSADESADGGEPPAPLPGADQLSSLVDRFTATGHVEARLDAAPEAVGALTRDTGSTVYRTVAEALTNVRRHAPSATRVDVALTLRRAPEGPDTVAHSVTLSVTNDGVPAGTLTRPRLRRGGGHGLAGLRERLAEAGGTLSAGPQDGGWSLVAVLPAEGA